MSEKIHYSVTKIGNTEALEAVPMLTMFPNHEVDEALKTGKPLELKTDQSFLSISIAKIKHANGELK